MEKERERRVSCAKCVDAVLNIEQGHPLDPSQSFDLAIIGGGINGVGIARDAAGRGLKVCLIEQDDLAAHTSSASTKLIHGGLRYLEYREFRLVREALIERERLLAIAPHIIWPMSFVLPHVEELRSRWLIRLGLFVYDHIGGRKRLPASRSVNFSRSDCGAPLKAHLKHGFIYADCWVQDSRLVVLNAMDAAARGAKILTRTRLLAAHANDRHWTANCVDTNTGAAFSIEAKAIVNASGPWVSEVLVQRMQRRSDKLVRLVQGSHIVVPQIFSGPQAYFLQNPDGRIVFAIPYEERFTLIGTTDVPYYGDPAAARISENEIAYLCESVNRYFEKSISPKDIVWNYSGVRPLHDDATADAKAVTRDYELEINAHDDQPKLLSVFGGKITTYRKLAEHALEKLQPFVGGDTEPWTGNVPLPGGEFKKGNFAAFLKRSKQRWPFVAPSLLLRLARAYGTRIALILENAKSLQDLGEDFGGGLSRAEVDYLVAHEWAQTSQDILWRRSKLGLHVPADTAAKVDRYLQKR